MGTELSVSVKWNLLSEPEANFRQGVWVYCLEAHGGDCPASLGVFYVGVSNNPFARLLEHSNSPHSGSLSAIFEHAKSREWKIDMRVLKGFEVLEEAEVLEKQLIRHYVEDGEYQLANMEGMFYPMSDWIVGEIAGEKEEQGEEPIHDSHVVAFTGQKVVRSATT